MDAEAPQSRTQKKKADRALQRLGEELLSLSDEQVATIGMPEELGQAIRACRRMKSHGARRRQLQYIGTLMRHIDAGPIQQALERIRDGDLQKALTFKQLEEWRDVLQAGDASLLEEILEQCPDADRQRLTQLMRNARQAAGTGKAARASRMLFRYLKEVNQ